MGKWKCDYLLLVDSNFITFASEGWSDGYADLEDDSNEIIKQLYGKISDDKLVECIVEYKNGYEYGSDMSKHCDEVYDEDGIINEGWDNPGPILDYTEDATALVKNYKRI